jgi:hypothetical protein
MLLAYELNSLIVSFIFRSFNAYEHISAKITFLLQNKLCFILVVTVFV